MANAFKRLFPETNIAGFSRSNVTLTFYNLVNGIVRPDDVVVDLGAGRGGQIELAENHHVRNLLTLKGRCKKLIGLDVDEAVLQNKYVDEAIVFDPNAPLPLETGSIDVIYADWVLEHIERPDQFAREVYRVLKPGGWFCARTPNKWGIIGLSGRLIPNSMHVKILAALQPDRKEEDVFPTFHRMNSLGQLRALFPAGTWNNHSFNDGFEVAYFRRSLPLAWLGILYNKLVPSGLGLVLFAMLQKTGAVAK